MRRTASLAVSCLLVALLATMFAVEAPAAERKVNIYFWYDYIPPEVIKDFETETGIKVVYDTFDSLEFMMTKVLTGKTGYDVILPSAAMMSRLVKAGALTKLDKSRLPSSKDLNPDIMKLLASQDPGNEHGVPYFYGTTGIIYNSKKIAERMKDAPVDSLDIIFKPEIAARFKDCGIAMVDYPEGVFSIALNYLGFDPFSKNEAEIEKAAALLSAARVNIRHFNTGSIINEMASGDICLALGWSADGLTAAARAAEAKNGVDVRYNIPKEGSNFFVDVMAIPEDAPDKDEAYAFINFLLKPRNIARCTNAILSANANSAASEFVDESIRNNPNVYPPKDVMAKLFAAAPRDAKSLRTVTRAWSKIVSGSQ